MVVPFLHYIGGQVRTKEGLGVVFDGSEKVLINPNPWDVLAIELRRRIARHFNGARFAEAHNAAAEAAQKVSSGWRDFYLGLKELCAAYDRWQRFEYGQVEGPFRKGFYGLKPYAEASNDQSLLAWLNAIQRDLERLKNITTAFRGLQKNVAPDLPSSRALVVDLVSNAVRVTRLLGRPDDGVARLYSALEN
jgi:hypothetical protein